jgi:hypothetical protein
VLQCIWPDAIGRYPWDADFPQVLHALQPLLAAKDDWPFAEPKNHAVFTTRPVIDDGMPILYVSHDDDGAWQFLCGTTNATEDCLLVLLANVLKRDPSVAELFDLPPGWCAERESQMDSWHQSQLR